MHSGTAKRNGFAVTGSTKSLLQPSAAFKRYYVGEDVTVRTDRSGWNAIAMTSNSSASGTVAQYDTYNMTMSYGTITDSASATNV